MPWAIAESFIGAAASLLATLMVARLLLPADFGLASLALAAVALVEVMLLSGLPIALVRVRHADTTLLDTAFWIMLGLGLAASALCVAGAWLMAVVFAEPELFGLTAVFGLNCLFTALMSVPTAYMTRKLRTRRFALRTLAIRLCAVTVTIGTALMGAQAWSIVLGILAGNLIGAIVLWIGMPRLPKLRFHLADIRPTLRMGWLISVEQIISSITLRAFILVFGRLHGVYELGLFNFALRLIDEVANLLKTVTSRLGLAYFSAVHRANGPIGAAFVRGSHVLTLVSSPTLFGIAAVAPDLIPLAFGEKWRGASVAVQILAIFWALQFTRILSPPVMRTVGRQGPLVINAALAAIVTMAMLFLTANMPLVIAVLAYCARLVVTLPAGIGLLRSAAGLSVRDQVGAVVMPIFASTIMFAAVWVSRAYLLQDLLMLWRLLFEILIGAVVYIGAALLFDRKRCVEEARFWLTKGAALANVKPAHRREK